MEFDAKNVEKELNEIGKRIRKPVDIYLIGGAAMSLRRFKETTKDIDIVFVNDDDYIIFKDALFGAQYHEPVTIRSEYENLETMKMYENKDGLSVVWRNSTEYINLMFRF
jgi:DNA polymerase/3'-5' exonuclease PolX